jgi:hypothetical protein
MAFSGSDHYSSFGKLPNTNRLRSWMYDVPRTLPLDALLKKDKAEELDDLEYQFRVVHTFDNASKGKAHINLLVKLEEGKSIQHVPKLGNQRLYLNA